MSFEMKACGCEESNALCIQCRRRRRRRRKRNTPSRQRKRIGAFHGLLLVFISFQSHVCRGIGPGSFDDPLSNNDGDWILPKESKGGREGAIQFLLSGVPTPTPTMPPSLAPSTAPTEAPSAIPSTAPTKSPSLFPTLVPSLTPSRFPSPSPSLIPSSNPTLSTPSEYPSTSPIRLTVDGIPLLHPTLSPTKRPTWPPIRGPTRPTRLPSPLPTTSQPSTQPSTQPSLNALAVSTLLEIHLSPVPSQKMNETMEVAFATAIHDFLSGQLSIEPPQIRIVDVLVVTQELYSQRRRILLSQEEMDHRTDMELNKTSSIFRSNASSSILDGSQDENEDSNPKSQVDIADPTTVVFDSINAVGLMVRGEFTPNPPTLVVAEDVDLDALLEGVLRADSDLLVQSLLLSNGNYEYFSRITTIQTTAMVEENKQQEKQQDQNHSNQTTGSNQTDPGAVITNEDNDVSTSNAGGAAPAIVLVSIGIGALLTIICSVAVLWYRARSQKEAVVEGSKTGAFPKTSDPTPTTAATAETTSQCLGYLTVDEERRDDASSLTYSRVLDNGQSFSFDDATAPAPDKPHFKADELLGPMPGETFRDEEEGEEHTNEMFFDLSNANLKGNI